MEAGGVEAAAKVGASEPEADKGSADGTIMRNDSSVSRCAERAFKFVEPNKVKIGGDFESGESQIPESADQIVNL